MQALPGKHQDDIKRSKSSIPADAIIMVVSEHSVLMDESKLTGPARPLMIESMCTCAFTVPNAKRL